MLYLYLNEYNMLFFGKQKYLHNKYINQLA